MKKLFCVTFSTIFILLVCLSTAFAAVGDKGAASYYQVVVTKFEMYNGTSWITVSDGSSTAMDIASVNVGAVVGNMFEGLDVPDGAYTQVRVTISNTFVISGSVGALYTTAAKAGGACVSTGVAANEARCTVDVPGGLPAPTPDILPSTLTVVGGVPSHKIRVNFNVSQAIEEGAGNLLFPTEPTVTMTMIAL